jgi:hypothetical protein
LSDIHKISRSSVTSDLAFGSQSAHHGQGGGGAERAGRNSRNSFSFKILTCKPFALKILQAIFAEAAPGKAFRRGGRGGTPAELKFFPEWNSVKQGSCERLPNIF